MIAPTILFFFNAFCNIKSTVRFIVLRSQRPTKTNPKNTRAAENQDTNRHLIPKKLQGVKEKTSMSFRRA